MPIVVECDDAKVANLIHWDSGSHSFWLGCWHDTDGMAAMGMPFRITACHISSC